MNVEIFIKKFSDITEDQWKRFRQLCFPDGHMKCYIKNRKRYPDFPICFAVVNEEIVGWCLFFQRFEAVGVFVDEKFRRLGIGKRLVSSIAKHVGLNELMVGPHDSVSSEFFKSFKSFEIAKKSTGRGYFYFDYQINLENQ